MDKTPVILCFKWGKGYPATYTNILYRAVQDMHPDPVRFVCMTDDPAPLDPGIETIPFPAIAMPQADWSKGMWAKLCAFAPGLFPDGTPVLMLDVDIVLLDDLRPFVDTIRTKPGLHISRDFPDTLPRLFPKWFGKPLQSNSSVVGFLAGTQTHLFEDFKDKTLADLRSTRNDQNYIHSAATDRHHWPDNWVLSFKRSCVYHFPVNLIRGVPKPQGRIVIFHGTPNPQDLIGPGFKRWGTNEKFGFFPVKWVQAYWHKYGGPRRPASDDRI